MKVHKVNAAHVTACGARMERNPSTVINITEIWDLVTCLRCLRFKPKRRGEGLKRLYLVTCAVLLALPWITPSHKPAEPQFYFFPAVGSWRGGSSFRVEFTSGTERHMEVYVMVTSSGTIVKHGPDQKIIELLIDQLQKSSEKEYQMRHELDTCPPEIRS